MEVKNPENPSAVLTPDAPHTITEEPKELSYFERVEIKKEEDLAFLRNNYGLEIEMGRQSDEDSPWLGSLNRVDPYYQPRVVRNIVEEISKYPPEFIRNIGLKNIRVSNGLQLKDDVTGSDGFAPAELPMIYVSMTDIDEMRSTLHHEIFHRGDFAFWGGSFIRETMGLFYDFSWISLNPKGFDHYSREKYDSIMALKTPEPEGFTRYYGTKDEMEDRATLAEEVMMNIGPAKARADDEPAFFRKMRRMMKLYKKRSDGKMNLDYFNDLLHSRVGEGYWFKDRTPATKAA